MNRRQNADAVVVARRCCAKELVGRGKLSSKTRANADGVPTPRRGVERAGMGCARAIRPGRRSAGSAFRDRAFGEIDPQEAGACGPRIDGLRVVLGGDPVPVLDCRMPTTPEGLGRQRRFKRTSSPQNFFRNSAWKSGTGSARAS
jgi:hypothetical protein